MPISQREFLDGEHARFGNEAMRMGDTPERRCESGPLCPACGSVNVASILCDDGGEDEAALLYCRDCRFRCAAP